MEKRPKLNKDISIKDFKEFYWLKKELMQFCRNEKLHTSGGKIEISERIIHYLKTGKKQTPKKIKTYATFNWNVETLTRETKITDNYKNTENVRKFFELEIGPQFKFNVKFMTWMNSNIGKTLNDAILKWHEIILEKKSATQPKEIEAQFEYNKYLRDFLADNPTLTRDKGIKLWKIKRSLRGDNNYNKADLKLLKK